MSTPNWTQDETLDLSNRGLTEIPNWVFERSHLRTLYLCDNQITELPDAIAQLKHLENLDLTRNQLTRLPESIGFLQQLTGLYLSFNKLTSLPESITRLQNLMNLDLWNNELQIPPPEVAERGIEAIRGYFRQSKEHGQEKLYEAKLLVLGEGEAGKTTFANKLKNPDYQLKVEDSTKGVDIIQWTFPTESDRDFKVNVWDFGGQEVYRATHQFFLTKRSLYILVADNRKESTDFYYWLSVAELFGDSSPLLIVNNEKQDRKKELNESQLKDQFNNIKEVLDTNLLTNSGLDRVREKVKYYLTSMPHIGSPLPKAWVRVREALKGDKRNYISLENYLEICKKNNVTNTKDGLQCSNYLNDIGVFLHFQDDPLLRKTIILKSKWGTDAVYKLLDHPVIQANKGRFSRADAESIWNEAEYENMHGELLGLMMRFRLCYEIPNHGGIYIAPQLLSDKQPDYGWDENENLFLQYRYEFMPKGILLQFIVAMSDNIWNQTVWKSGVVLEEYGSHAEVIEVYGKRRIDIRISGVQKKELMTIVIHELDKIHKAYRQLKYDKMIPCNCKKCKTRETPGTPHFYTLEGLQRRLAANRQFVECDISYEKVNIRSLIDDIIEPKIVYNENGVTVVQYYYGDYIEGDKKMTEIKQTIVNSTIYGNAVAAESIKDSFNTIEKADIKDELKEQLKLLTQAVEAMVKELPKEKAEDAAEDMKMLVEQATKEKPNPKWYNVSIDGLIKAAENLGKVGEPVVELSRKVLSLLTMGVIK